VFYEWNAPSRLIASSNTCVSSYIVFMSVHDVYTDAQRSSFILRCEVTTVVFIKILDFETSKEF
jgi:hypothetical protein